VHHSEIPSLKRDSHELRDKDLDTPDRPQTREIAGPLPPRTRLQRRSPPRPRAAGLGACGDGLLVFRPRAVVSHRSSNGWVSTGVIGLLSTGQRTRISPCGTPRRLPPIARAARLLTTPGASWAAGRAASPLGAGSGVAVSPARPDHAGKGSSLSRARPQGRTYSRR
jgi:hypothetical protein